MLACGREERPFRSTRQTGASGTGCRGLRALQRPRSWLGCQVLTRVTGSPPTPPATCERGYGWRGPRLPPGPWSEVAEERQRVFCRVQVPTRLCWPPRPSAGRQPFITASAGSSPRHSCLSHSPPAGSPSATSGVPRPRTRRLARPPVTCSRQVAVGLGLGGHTSSHASSSPVKEMNFLEPWGGGGMPPAFRSPGGLCTSLPTATSQTGLGGQQWTVRHTPQGALDEGSTESHIR